MGAVVRGEGLVAGEDISLPQRVVDSAPVLYTLWVEVGGTRHNGDPRGFLNENNICNGEL